MANTPPRQARQLRPWLRKSLNWAGRLGHPVVVSTVVTSAVVLGVRALGGLQGLELGVYDQMMRLRPTPPPDDRLLVVGIGETDIQVRQEWPIEDSTVTELLQILLAAEPRAIGLDIFRDVPIGEGHAELLNEIQGSDRIIPVCKISSPDNPGVPPPEGTPPPQVSFSDLVVDPGGILRRSLLAATPPEESVLVGEHVCSDPEVQLFSLSLQLALRYLAAENINPTLTANQEIQFNDTVLPRLTPSKGGYRNIDAGGYQLMLNFRRARDAVPQVSLTSVLSGEIPPAQIRDRIVLIGATTPEAKDDFYTPYSGGLEDSQKMPGVMVHAQSVSQILSAVLDGRPLLRSWPAWTEGLWIIVWGGIGGLFAWRVRRPVRYTLGAIALAGGLYGACYLFLLHGLWIPLVPPILTLGLAAGMVVLLDRFNKSDYGQAVYKQMKSLLRLDIEIDHDKVGQQVAEITETEYFSNLQQQARHLRQQRLQKDSSSQHSADAARSESSSELPGDMDHMVDELKQKARRLRASNEAATTDHDDDPPQ